MIEQLILIFSVLLFILLAEELSLVSTYEMKGSIRFIIRSADRWSSFKEFLNLQPSYEGYFAYKNDNSNKPDWVYFKTDRKNYLEMIKDFSDGREIEVVYTERILGYGKLSKKQS